MTTLFVYIHNVARIFNEETSILNISAWFRTMNLWTVFSSMETSDMQPKRTFADIYVWLFAFCLNVQILVLKNKNLHTFWEIFINFGHLKGMCEWGF